MPHHDGIVSNSGLNPAADGDFLKVYEQLRAIARQMLLDQKPGHTLQATALVHEAWLRLLHSGQAGQTSTEHYHRLAATAMRHILIDHARTRCRQKRGGRRQRISLDAVELVFEGDSESILAVDEAIGRLREHDPALADLVNLRFFAGLSVEEAARALGQSERSTYRDWDYAKALLLRELNKGE